MAKFTVGHYGAQCNTAILERLGGPIWSLTFLLLCSIVLSTTTQILPCHGEMTVSECKCPGDKQIYMCAVQGNATGATIWNGTAFSGCQQNPNEILLQHSRFNTTGSTGTCNNGNIVGQSVSVQGNNYTSQLNVTITLDTVGKTVTCAYDALSSDQTQDIIKFSTKVPGQLPPPNKLYITTANFVSRHLTFSWSPVAPDCPAIHYNILASNCGSCPTTTNHTTATCTDVPPENIVCTFAIQPVMCGSLVGNKSDPVSVTTTRGEVIIKDSLSTLVTGGLMIFLGVVLISGCLLYMVIKRSRICPQRTNFQVPLQTSEEVGNMVYSICERPSPNMFTNRGSNSHYKEPPLELNSLLYTLHGQISDSQWYQFGVAIGVPRRVLNQIENYSEESRLAEVLDYWLKHHPGQPSWKEITDAQGKIGAVESMAEYSCLDTQVPDNGKVSRPSKPPRRTSVNKPQSLYSEDVYDKAFHRN